MSLSFTRCYSRWILRVIGSRSPVQTVIATNLHTACTRVTFSRVSKEHSTTEGNTMQDLTQPYVGIMVGHAQPYVVVVVTPHSEHPEMVPARDYQDGYMFRTSANLAGFQEALSKGLPYYGLLDYTTCRPIEL
jgi:hypothetical protein